MDGDKRKTLNDRLIHWITRDKDWKADGVGRSKKNVIHWNLRYRAKER